MKEKIFNIIQIGDKSNKISRAFDIFITIIIVGNIIVRSEKKIHSDFYFKTYKIHNLCNLTI